jgi:DNA-binding CsgD family transcriptional regulator
MAVGDQVIGRSGELEALAAFVHGLAERPSALVFEGEAGAGKTTLWLAGVTRARESGAHVLSARPVQAESQLGLAGVGDLLEGLLERILPALPRPQAEALRVALALEPPRDAAREDRALAMAVLNAVRSLAGERPVLVAVDDIQWMDAGSAGVLGFAWRRLRDEPVALLLTQRSGERAVWSPAQADPRLRRVPLGPLSLGAVHRLLEARLGLVVARTPLRRIHEVSGGNPFYALEIGRALQQRQSGMAPGEPLPIPDGLRGVGRDRIEALPAATRRALALVAALARPTVGLVARAVSAATLEPAFAAQVLVQDGDRIRFSHPLLAAAAYEGLDPLARLVLHRRLAGLLEGEESARHLGLAADGPDPAVAAALERASLQARTRGAIASAAELCEHALALTPGVDDDGRHRRMVAAARYRFAAGETARAGELLEPAVVAGGSGPWRAEALVALARVHLHGGDQQRARDLAARAVAEAAGDQRLEADGAQLLASAMFFLREELPDALRHATRATILAAETEDVTLRGTAGGMKAVIEAVLGRAEWQATLRSFAHVGDAPPGKPVVCSPGWHEAMIAVWTDRAEKAVGLMRRYRDAAVLQGDEGSLPLILAFMTVAEFVCGRWLDAEALADESLDIAVQAGQPPHQAFALGARALVRAARGFEHEARADVAAALELAGEHGMAVARIHCMWALAILELSLERPQAAADTVGELRRHLVGAGVREPGGIPFAADEVEALIRSGRRDEAEAQLYRLERDARAVGRVSALAAAARCRGLLAAERGDLDATLACLEKALAHYDGVESPFERARTLLTFGTALRRSKRRAAARATLEQTIREFDELGAALWSARARAELSRIGGRRPAPGGLTPTERRLAGLVSEGRSNKEIAVIMFVTPKTVETQLSRLYGKLGVHSRTALARRVGNL